MSEPLTILLVEDDEDDYVLADALLADVYGRDFDLEWAATWDEAILAMERGGHDVCLLDYRLGHANGLELISAAVQRGYDAPIIMLTGHSSRQTDFAAMRAGAADYLVKDELTAPLLERTIRYAIERKRIENQLSALARHDPLTGLANRAMFGERLEAAIAQARRSRRALAVMLIDLDHFKQVNDTLGHAAGDQLLCQIGERLRLSVRDTDTVARLGGDEFAVIATNIAMADDAALLAHKIKDSLNLPLQLEGRSCPASTSIGISLAAPDEADAAQMVKHADLALYQAKAAGRNTYRFYGTRMNARVQAHEVLENPVREALCLLFQPRVNIVTGEMVAADALLRWVHPERGPVTPAEFLAAAGCSASMRALGEWVLREALANRVAWRGTGILAIPVSVKLTGVDLRSPDLSARIERMLAAANQQPQSLELRLSEGTIMAEGEVMIGALERLRDLGVGIALGGFGSGCIALRRLVETPLSRIEIGRSVVDTCTGTSPGSRFAAALVALGSTLGLTVTASGVETPEQMDVLRDIGCDEAKGYLISTPLSSQALVDWYRRREGAAAALPARPVAGKHS